MFGIGYPELVIIGIVAVILFGGRLPQVARSMGKSLTEFKKGMQDLEGHVSDAIHSQPTSSPHSAQVEHDDLSEPSAPRFEPPTTPPQTVDEKPPQTVNDN
jgi:sec-independent protein translocase protein TatA